MRGNDGGSIASGISARASEAPPEVAKHLETHATVLRTSEGVRDAVVKALPEGVGGQFDGSVSLAKTTLIGHEGESLTTSQKRIKEVGKHENYHEQHDHLQPMQGVGHEDGALLKLGGKTFDNTGLVEGMTVHKTGAEFVSNGYRTYKSDLEGAAANAGVSMAEVEAAIDKKDLSSIDDATRQKKEEDSFAIAA